MKLENVDLLEKKSSGAQCLDASIHSQLSQMMPKLRSRRKVADNITGRAQKTPKTPKAPKIPLSTQRKTKRLSDKIKFVNLDCCCCGQGNASLCSLGTNITVSTASTVCSSYACITLSTNNSSRTPKLSSKRKVMEKMSIPKTPSLTQRKTKKLSDKIKFVNLDGSCSRWGSASVYSLSTILTASTACFSDTCDTLSTDNSSRTPKLSLKRKVAEKFSMPKTPSSTRRKSKKYLTKLNLLI